MGEPWLPDGTGRLQGWKFDNRTNALQQDTNAAPLFDLMSYCTGDATSWISPRNWNRAMRVLRDFDKTNRARAAAGPAARAAQAGQGYALGSVDARGARIYRVVPADADNRAPVSDPSSPLHLRSVDASGRLLADAGAQIQMLHDAAPGTATFVVAVPPGASAVELVAQGRLLDRRTRTSPPSVRVLAPRAGTRVGRSLLVRWSASDPDGEQLQAVVDFAANGVSGWRTVFQGRSGGRVSIPARYLEASRSARVRVTVSDGFSETRALSGRFSTPGAPPTARILRPDRGEPLQAGPVVLFGDARDGRGRRLRGAKLTWFAGSERLGTGERLRTSLPAGPVTLRLVAQDGGREAAAVRRVRGPPSRCGSRACASRPGSPAAPARQRSG